MAGIRIIARLWVREGQSEAFETFENAAFALMVQHGGFVQSVQKRHSTAVDEPDEIHTIEFPDRHSFEAYQSDPVLLGMAELRKSCISNTEVIIDEMCPE